MFGGALEKARKVHLARITGGRNILLIGEGNGRFLAQCVEAKEGGSITIVDSSAGMLASSRSRLGTMKVRTDLRFVCADFRAWPCASACYDTIVTHFFLDLFSPASQLRIIQKVSQVATPEAWWADVDYHFHERSYWFHCIDWLQYRFDRLFSGIEASRHHDPTALLRSLGWRVCEERRMTRWPVTAQLMRRPPPCP